MDDAATSLDRLRAALAGHLLLPGDDGWDEARAPWNRSVDQHPAAVVIADGVDDIRATLLAAREAGLTVTVQPHGHGVSTALEGSILIRPDRLDELHVDVAARTVRAGAGVDWGRVLAALDGTGLVALAGSNPEVSVVGYSLAGGHSMFSRAFGLAANAVVGLDVVLADGTAMRVDAGTDTELFWALRGGGGLFGIVTAIEFRVFPIPGSSVLCGGKLTYPGEAAEQALGALAALAPALPDEVSVSGVLMSLPDAPFVPEPMRGRTIASIDIVSLLDADATAALIAPLRAAPLIADTIAEFPVGRLPEVAAEPVEPMAAVDRGLALATLDADAVGALVTAFRAAAERGLSLLQIRPLGGAVARANPDAGVAGSLRAAALVGTSVVRPGIDEAGAREALSIVIDAAAPFAAPGLVATFLSAGDDLGRAYPAADIERLRTVRRRVDPDGLLVSNRPLPSPAG